MPYTQAKLLIDRSAWDEAKLARVLSHTIFQTILDEISSAENFLILDFFLWNPWKGAIESTESMPNLSQQLADALIAKHAERPEMPILVITDPINRIYSDHAPAFFDALALADIPVVFTDVNALPDSNRVYAPQARFWSRFFEPSADQSSGGDLPNPFDPNGRGLSRAAMAKLLYFKANHRKVLVSGRSDGRARLIVGSFNPADGSAFHSNMAVRVEGPIAVFAAKSELEIADWSTELEGRVHKLSTASAKRAIRRIRKRLEPRFDLPEVTAETPTVRWISEGAIRDRMIAELNAAGPGAEVDGAIFYFSDRLLVEAMRAAIVRGVQVRLLMDVNRDAFGREKNGIPNRMVAAELMSLSDEGSISVRWADTHGEQFHTKALRVRSAERDVLILGSGNWTRRNLGNLNLEANLMFERSEALGQEFDRYFTSVWENQSPYTESVPYEAWSETGWNLKWKTWLYRFQEWSGASTF